MPYYICENCGESNGADAWSCEFCGMDQCHRNWYCENCDYFNHNVLCEMCGQRCIGEGDENCDEGEVFFTHYSSFQRILLVGEGDFSFALCLANAFGSASNLVATSFDTREEVEETYSNAEENIAALEDMGGTIYFRVDAREMSEYKIFSEECFDRIIFNFPHAGFHAPERSQLQIRRLIRDFLENAKYMLDGDGEIHVTHRSDYPYSRWNSIGLGRSVGLVHCAPTVFRAEDYYGYKARRGQGPFSHESFPTRPSCTFKFRLPHRHRNFQ